MIAKYTSKVFSLWRIDRSQITQISGFWLGLITQVKISQETTICGIQIKEMTSICRNHQYWQELYLVDWLLAWDQNPDNQDFRKSVFNPQSNHEEMDKNYQRMLISCWYCVFIISSVSEVIPLGARYLSSLTCPLPSTVSRQQTCHHVLREENILRTCSQNSCSQLITVTVWRSE